MRVVKRILLWLLLVAILIVAIIGGALAWSYRSTDPEAFTVPAVRAGGAALSPNSYEWHAPVMGGILYRSAAAPATLERQDLGVWDAPSMEVALPEGLPVHLAVRDAAGKVLLDVNNEPRVTVEFPANGAYTLEADVTQPEAPEGRTAHGYGSFRYAACVTVAVAPKIEFSALRVEQGGVVTVRITGFLDGLEPSIETDLSMARFCPVPGGMAASIGIHYNREPGEYPVRVVCGGEETVETVTVVHRDFPRQDMTVDPALAASTMYSPTANQEWRDTIYPLYESFDPELYWSGTFVRPCAAAEQNSEYGLFRYTNGSSRPERHAGIDYDCDLGDDIWSPARGRVVYAGYLQMTGNTVVVEHGGGLKSYFFHMDALACAQGDLVEREQVIGQAGATGYVTGPHLHYEARIGNQSIDPDQLFNGASGLYFAQR